MKVTLSHTITPFLSAAGILVAFINMLAVGSEPASPDNRYEKPAIKVFGTKSGKPIESGFVFKDAAYVEAPYIISRRSVDIYVNEIKVATPVRWPPVDYDDKKPAVPTGLTRNSTFKDLEIRDCPGDSFDRKMVRWLSRHYSKPEARGMIAEYYRTLPFVAHVEPMGDFLVVSTWNSDKKMMISIAGQPYVPPTPEELLKELERVRTQWEERLKKGDCCFLLSSGGQLSFGSRKAAMDLAAIVQTLRSDKPKDEKTKKLQKLGLLTPDFPKKWEVLVTNFSASPQLDERVKQLRLLPGDKGERGHTVEEEQAQIEKMMKEKAAKEKEPNK